MRKHLCSLLLALLAALSLPAAERLKQEPGPEDLDYLKNFRPARVRQWAHPRYAPEPDAQWVERAVRVAFEVDTEGGVQDARVMGGAEEFAAAALEAVSTWKFEPELVHGRPVPASKEVRVVFSPRGPPKKTAQDEFWCPYPIEDPQTTPPGEPADPAARYPASLLKRRLSGEVELLLGIDTEGRVDGVEIGQVTHVEFLSAALETVAGWQLRPARKGRLPQRGLKRAVLSFHPVDEEGRLIRVEWLERNGIQLRMPAGAKSTAHFDHTPEAPVVADPVFPHEHLMAGAAGAARVNFSVNAEGRITSVRVDEATAPEFGESLVAAIEAWQFHPLHKDGKECWADFSMTWRFEAPPAGSAERRLLDNLGTGQDAVDARQLDRRLAPLFIRQAVYPAALREAGEEGEARIEAIVDRDGRVRLPHIRSATRPEFGWAAATAVSQWLFETPRKGGEPVAVRVVIPVKFKAPATGQ